MSKDKMAICSLPIQFLIITIITTCILGLLGCRSSHNERQEAVRASFSNEMVEVKATTYRDQFIVRCENGSIWEVKASLYNPGSYSTISQISILYKNCLFDAIFEKPENMELPKLPLEK